MENRTMVQHNGNTYNSDNSWTWMRGSSECVSVYVSELRWMLSCDATWKMIDRVYPELKSEQDEYRFKVEFREAELE